MKGRVVLFALLALALVGCCRNDGWTERERSLINDPDSLMRVLTVDNAADSAVLRKISSDLSTDMLRSEEMVRLGNKMLCTVQSPQQAGVGIAAPQVGISRRMVAVMRRDKDGDPFELFPNIRITAFYGDLVDGREGCLSVPDMRGVVPRYRSIDIAYTCPRTLRDTTEHIEGFTAVIFQHECDHLDGVLYTDRIE